MSIHEVVVEMKLLERRLTLYDEKYGVLSENFYTALLSWNFKHLANTSLFLRPAAFARVGE